MNLYARKNQDGGFTLVELLVVIVILCILGAVTIFVFSDIEGRTNNRPKSAPAKPSVTLQIGNTKAAGSYTCKPSK